MKRRAVILGAAALCFSFVLAGCKTTGPVIPEPQSLPGGAKFAGVWYSSQFDQMYIRQTGDTINGIYTYKYGGTLEGKVSGNLLMFDWIDPGDQDRARRTFKGKGYLQLVKEGDRLFLRGRWGYNDSATDGGPWEAEYIRELEDEDPRNLKDFRDSSVR